MNSTIVRSRSIFTETGSADICFIVTVTATFVGFKLSDVRPDSHPIPSIDSKNRRNIQMRVNNAGAYSSNMYVMVSVREFALRG